MPLARNTCPFLVRVQLTGAAKQDFEAASLVITGLLKTRKVDGVIISSHTDAADIAAEALFVLELLARFKAQPKKKRTKPFYVGWDISRLTFSGDGLQIFTETITQFSELGPFVLIVGPEHTSVNWGEQCEVMLSSNRTLDGDSYQYVKTQVILRNSGSFPQCELEEAYDHLPAHVSLGYEGSLDETVIYDDEGDDKDEDASGIIRFLFNLEVSFIIVPLESLMWGGDLNKELLKEVRTAIDFYWNQDERQTLM